MPENQNIQRRDFIKRSAAFGILTILPSGIYAQQGKRVSPNGKIQVACVGVGGRGRAVMNSCKSEQIVALCDVDLRRAQASFKQHSQVPHFTSHTEMLEKMGDKIDAVTVASPDHAHYAAAIEAVKLGKHVYVEKPLCQTVADTRALQAAAKKAGVKTQMGNQGHSKDSIRQLKEWVDAGLLGDVKEIHTWTNRPHGWWKQGMKELPETKNVPKELDWNLWKSGVGPDIGYNEAYLPFLWRGWTMWGCGSLGDMGCHILDPAYYALELGAPDWVEATAEGGTDVAFPDRSEVTFHFPARNGKATVTVKWWDGGGKSVPPTPEVLGDTKLAFGNNSGGALYFGDKEFVMSDSHAAKIACISEGKVKPLNAEKKYRRVKGQDHTKDWFAAIRGDINQASSHFDYSAGLTEMVLLGVIAQRLPGKRLNWNGKTGQFTNSDLGNKMLSSAII
ncbi:NADH-dependent dehydrogenase [Oceaniferula spumae]|uniref:NADH-dependent dehydrogenase n=1 Tax=Oceaniferula spumae TaxID=2979115 RepID=A0AAT9FNK6_9BACT